MTSEDEALQTTDTLADLARGLPDEVLLFLVRNAPTRDAWKWLGENPRLQFELSRGFQSTPNSLRQPVVRNRLVHHIRTEPEAFERLLSLWAGTTPPPHVVSEIAELDDEALPPALAPLWKQHGGEALLLALLNGKRDAALDAYAALDPEKFDDETENELIDEAQLEAPAQPVAPANPQLEAELARARSEAQKLRAQCESLTSELAALRLTQTRENQAQKLKLKQDEHKRAGIEQELGEARKTLDRTSRRQRHVEKELEESTAEAKRLKRQLRQAQQLHEELRKQNAALAARLPQSPAPENPVGSAKTKAAAKAPAAAPSKTISPLDQQFVWKSDGRQFRVTPREVGRAIDQNNEELVFTLIQAFETLREMNLTGYKLFIERIRALGRYYVRVMTADTTRVLIDASNVARYEKDRYGKGQLKHLIATRNELRLRDCFPIFSYADASLIHNIDEPGELAAMAKRGELEIVPAGTEADEILAREARRTGAYVVTNDRNFYLKVTPDFEPPRISFRIMDGFLVIDDF